jgi:glycolate oxidase FAD binding subunit
MTDVIARFTDSVRAASAARTPLCIRGSGSKDFYGNACAGDLLDTRTHAGIVDYEPSELVVTARCGTPLSELEAALAAKGQMLAFEPPHFGAGATVGGMLAAGLSGPRRQAAGPLRDFVLGMKVMDGRGDVLSFGGRVMKNVAGYDVSRLMAGSLGTLGLILEASLKTMPMPVMEATLRFELPEERAIETLNRWGGQPLPLSASVWHGNELHVRLSGAAAAVSAALAKLGGERLGDDEAGQVWADLRDQTHPFFQGGAPLWRLAVPSTLPSQALEALPGHRLVEWGGGLRWLATHADAQAVRDAASKAGGHATLFRGTDKSCGTFHPLPPAMMTLHRRLKLTFDPQGVFNPGRLYAGL